MQLGIGVGIAQRQRGSAYGPTNYIARPDAFDDALWTKSLATVTANAIAAPSGNVTADKLIATAVSGQHRVDYTTASTAGMQEFSVHLKAGEYGFANLRIGGVGSALGVNLADGTVAGTEAGASLATSPDGDGWYWCRLTVTSGTANAIARINIMSFLGSAQTAFTGDGTSGIYAADARLVSP